MADALLRRHRADDRLDAHQLALIHLGLGHVLHRAEFRQHSQHLVERAHAAKLLHLIAKILQREAVRQHLLLERLGLILIDRGLGLFDQGQDVAHAQDARNHALGVEDLQRIVPFADADELDRLARDLMNREGRAAARVAVQLGQHYAGKTQPFVELPGALDRVLTHHRIRNEQDLARPQLGSDLAQLLHQLIVDVEPPGAVDQ